MNFTGNNQIPGSNLLNMALRVIAKTPINYYQAVARPLNNIGQNVTLYAPVVMIFGSFQPVAREMYEILGLDLQKNYFRLFAPNNIIDIGRDVSADQIDFQGVRYQCESATPWYGIDGWVEMLCIDIGDVELGDVFGFNDYTTYPNLINDNQNFFLSNFAIGGSE